MRQYFGFGHALANLCQLAECGLSVRENLGRNGMPQQIVQRIHAERRQHGLYIVVAGADVPPDKRTKPLRRVRLGRGKDRGNRVARMVLDVARVSLGRVNQVAAPLKVNRYSTAILVYPSRAAQRS